MRITPKHAPTPKVLDVNIRVLVPNSRARVYIIKIQKMWKGYKTRKTINVYKRLPRDVWKIILDHIQIKNNVYKLYKSHIDVYTRRIYNIKYYYWRSLARMGLNFNSHNELNTLYLNTLNSLKYFNKIIQQIK